MPTNVIQAPKIGKLKSTIIPEPIPIIIAFMYLYIKNPILILCLRKHIL